MEPKNVELSFHFPFSSTFLVSFSPTIIRVALSEFFGYFVNRVLEKILAKNLWRRAQFQTKMQRKE